MHEEIEYYESKIQDLYERLEKANELVQDLKESKESFQSELEKIGYENKFLIEENEHLQNCISSTHNSLSLLNQNSEKTSIQTPPRKSLTVTIPKNNFEHSYKTHESVQEESFNLNEEMQNEPNVEQFLKQINELKALCKIQGEALFKFQETMESTKEDNEKLQTVFNELEDEKKGLSEMLMTSDIRSSIGFDYNSPASPVFPGSFDSSMFVSTIEAFEFDKQLNKKPRDEVHFRMHKCSLDLTEIMLFKSHITGLSI
ncbi:hypothetical protein SteCoe_33664 [Stentor coeruleus]|uniref:Uncharacterized protein n=1 Tax=Stentor coeruleus TaxID=5963 RepID=A0A1R2AW63_9CILI|nr:hypothetical protein SteCoe_33664 [Stentor coeruleus]